MLWPHDAVEVQAYWNAGGMGHAVLVRDGGRARLRRLRERVPGASGCTSATRSSRRPCCSPGRAPRRPSARRCRRSASSITCSRCARSLRRSTKTRRRSIRLLMAPAAPASRPAAILGLLLLTAFVLWIAARAVRRMQISYGRGSVTLVEVAPSGRRPGRREALSPLRFSRGRSPSFPARSPRTWSSCRSASATGEPGRSPRTRYTSPSQGWH